MWTRIKKYRLGIVVLLSPLLGFAQTGPVDLTELSLEDLLNVRVVTSNSADASLEQGGWIAGFQYVEASFGDYRKGRHKLSAERVLETFPVVPNRITQCAHVIRLGHRLEGNSAIMLKVPFLSQTTDHIRRKGDPFSIKTEGLGDISVLYSMMPYAEGRHQVWLTSGLRLPTGSITETGDTPRGKDTLVPYTMQLGSGTFDLEPSATYSWQGDQVKLGVSASGTLRLGRNARDYSLSDWANLEFWASVKPVAWLETAAKLRGSQWTRIDGRDVELDPVSVGVGDPSLYGGDRIMASGLAKFFCGDRLQHMISVEAGVPVYQDLNGPQPQLDYELNLNYAVEF